MSFSEAEPVFAPFLCLSLVLLEREQPALYARLCATFGTQRVNTSVGSEHVQIVGDGQALAVLPRLPSARSVSAGAISVESDVYTIDQVLDAQATLLELVQADRIRLYGTLEDLLRMHDALRLYLQAAVRCPSMPKLLRAFRVRVSATAHPAPAVEARLPALGRPPLQS